MSQSPLSNLTSSREIALRVSDYDLNATMTSGQVFGWEKADDSWVGVVNGTWVRLQPSSDGIRAVTATAQNDWTWLKCFLQTEVNLPALLATFPANDTHLSAALASCRGLRLLRQSPW